MQMVAIYIITISTNVEYAAVLTDNDNNFDEMKRQYNVGIIYSIASRASNELLAITI